jgi:signal transduction histidine kinase/CheY-like chemotaxis protein
MTVKVLGRRLPATLTYTAALGAVLLLLVLSIGAAFWQTSYNQQIYLEQRESGNRRSGYRILMQRMTDAETAQRGYLLTGDEDYLGPLTGARSEAVAVLSAMEAVAAPGSIYAEELAETRRLMEAKFEELQLTIDLSHAGRSNEARLIVGADNGRLMMDRIRAIFERVEARENAFIAEGRIRSDASAMRLQWVMLLSGLLIVGVGALLIITVRGAMSELRHARDQALDAQHMAVEEMSARSKAESQVRQLQKMETIGQITGGVAHDFNNMLAVIMSALQLAKRRLERGEPGAEGFIDAAVDGTRRAASLTSRLLAFARRQPLSPAVLDPNRVLGDMADMLRRTLGEQVVLETVLAGGLWRVNADRGELEQAILNVCVNARDAMPDGGKLTIEVSNAHLDEAYANANHDVKAGQYVMVAITDTGAGMSPEVQRQAFEPFFTTKEVGRGTGLGLSQVHGFLKQSGGHAAIYSEVGVGTSVKLYLPRTQHELSAESEVGSEQVDVAGDPAIIVLVVEDDERVRLLSVASLRDLGYTVLHASSGAEALQVLEAHPGIALLFTDVVMPEMTGKALSDEARRRWPHIKVLYTTGYTQNAIIHNGVLDADARLLLKPYSLNDLARKVRAVLNE